MIYVWCYILILLRMEILLASAESSLVAVSWYDSNLPLQNPNTNREDVNANLTISPDHPISAPAQVSKETRLIEQWQLWQKSQTSQARRQR